MLYCEWTSDLAGAGYDVYQMLFLFIVSYNMLIR